MNRLPIRPLRTLACLGVALLLGLPFGACGSGNGKGSVVVYCAQDQVYAEPIFADFQKKTGIEVKGQYDVEAQKTTGLVNRLIEEENNPQCDVFWSNELVQTLALKERGALTPYRSPNGKTIPAQFKDPAGDWTGFAARARVLLVNTKLMPLDKAPKRLEDLVDPRYKNKIAMSKPIFGTMFTQASALFAMWGEARAKRFFEDLKKNDVLVCAGNADVAYSVGNGDVPMGLTDTDDANVVHMKGNPVADVFLDQGKNGMGTLVIPNSVMLVKGAPHPAAAKKLIDYLLSPEVEKKLAESRSVQMPLHPGVAAPPGVPTVDSIKAMHVDWVKAAGMRKETATILSDIFIR